MSIDTFEGMPIIDESTSSDVLFPKGVTNKCIPRDLNVQPLPMKAVHIPLKYSRNDIIAMIRERKETKSMVRDMLLRGGYKRAIQWEYGYCWAHAPVNAMMADRIIRGQPHKQLSAFYTAMREMNYRDEGGWSPLAFQRIQKEGAPETSVFPEDDRSSRFRNNSEWRKYDTAEAAANAAQHKIVEGWIDLDKNVWDATLTFEQIMNLWATYTVGTSDYADMRHSMGWCDIEEIEPGSLGLVQLNSWQPGVPGGDFMIRREQLVRPMSACAIGTTSISV